MVSKIGPNDNSLKAKSLKVPHPRLSIDIATIVGIPGAFLLVTIAIMLGGSIETFLDLNQF